MQAKLEFADRVKWVETS